MRQLRELADESRGVGPDEVRERDGAGQPFAGVHREHPGERVGGDRRPPHPVEGFFDAGLLVDTGEVRAHQAARRRRVVSEERPHPPTLHGRQAFQHRLTPLLRERADEVGRVVGLHPRDQLGHLRVGSVFEKLDLVERLELLEDVGLELGIVSALGSRYPDRRRSFHRLAPRGRSAERAAQVVDASDPTSVLRPQLTSRHE